MFFVGGERHGQVTPLDRPLPLGEGRGEGLPATSVSSISSHPLRVTLNAARFYASLWVNFTLHPSLFLSAAREPDACEDHYCRHECSRPDGLVQDKLTHDCG